MVSVRAFHNILKRQLQPKMSLSKPDLLICLPHSDGLIKFRLQNKLVGCIFIHGKYSDRDFNIFRN